MNNTEFPRHKKILLITNPYSRSASDLKEEIIREFEAASFQILNHDTGDDNLNPNDLIRRHKDEISVVVVAGGDGTVNLVLPALMQTKIPLLVVPCGTANNLARHYQIPCDPKKIVTILRENKIVDIDLGLVNDIPFVNVAGLGLSTEVNRKVSQNLKRHFGVFAFIVTALQLASSMNPFRAVITTDKNTVLPTKSWQISICNGKHYGAGMTIKHDASLDDGKLHCLSTEVRHWWEGLLLIPSFFRGRYKKSQEVTILSAREINIETRRRFHIDVDGDLKTTTPAHFKLLPHAIKILIPELT